MTVGGRTKARLYGWLVTLACAAGQTQAGVWGMDPVFGVTGDRSTNPQLLTVPDTAETNGALLLDAPMTYVADNTKFSLLPSFRLANAKGYSSVTSNYEHLNARGEYDTERGTLTATVGAARDSSLYYNYLSDGEVGVRRDSASAELMYDRLLSEKLEVNVDTSESRVRYAESQTVGTLTDYKYLSVAPTFSWNISPRDKYTLATGLGKYNSLDGATESRSANLQVGLVRQLSELWTLTATGGYSRALNSVNFNKPILVFTPSGPRVEFLPEKFESAQNGTVYSVELDHRGPQLLLSAIASRQVLPTGFAFLSRQESSELRATYALSPRWTLSGDVRQSKYDNPPTGTLPNSTTVPYASLGATWLWTEQWTVGLTLSRVRVSVQNSTFNEHSTEATINLSRHFGHLRL